MHSFVARLRGRAISQTTTLSTVSDDTPTTPEPQQSEHGPSVLTRQEHVTPVVLGRKILPHVHELMDSFEAEQDRPQGLSPPPSATRTPVSPWAELPSPLACAPAAEDDAKSNGPSPPSPRFSQRSNNGSSKAFSSASPSVPYSTFGRQDTRPLAETSSGRPMRLPLGSMDTFAQTSNLDHDFHAGNRSTSTASVQQDEVSLVSDKWNSRNNAPQEENTTPKSLDSDNNHERPSPAHTTSSRPHSVQHSMVTDSRHSVPSFPPSLHSVHTPNEQNNPLSSVSPHTFGHPTPPDSHLLVHEFNNVADVPPPPPLPPLVHPELVASLTARSHKRLRDISNVTVPAARKRFTSFNDKTYPPYRRRSSTDSPSKENAAPLLGSGTFGHVLRNYSSMPGVRQIFRTATHSDRGLTLSRTRSSTKSIRRTSAEWNAVQAIAGVNTDGVAAWPAEVSKEILRLSLGESAFATSRRRLSDIPLAAVAEDRQPRGRNVVEHPSGVRPYSPPLTSPSHPDSDEDDSEGGGELARSSRGTYSASIVPGVDAEEGSMRAQDGGSDTLKADSLSGASQAATFPRTASPHAQRKSILRPSSFTTQGSEAGPSSMQNPSPPSTPTRPRTRSSLRQAARASSEPSLMKVLETPVTYKGKRKAEEIDITPPDQRLGQQHAIDTVSFSSQNRAHNQSDPIRTSTANAPSAYPQRKRVRLSESSPAPSVTSHSRPGSANSSSVTGRPYPSPSPANRALSRAASTRSNQPSTINGTVPSTTQAANGGRDRRRTMSQVSIPVSALIAPHPPSLAPSSTYHMRDPHKPPPITSTPWIPRFRSAKVEGSPARAWYFFVGFIFFPLWWVASFLPIPRTRRVGGTDTEKAVTLDDPQVEHDARSWRFRFRIMSVLSLLTYVPFIILVAIFAPR